MLPRMLYAIASTVFLFTNLSFISSLIHSPQSFAKLISFNPEENIQDVQLNKVSFTQIGYIQFLKYYLHVPSLTEYTFCIWIKSNNLTHNHPLLSYSLHEEKRLIRVWITPEGRHISYELLGVPVFSIRTKMVEHKWYHVCQSWSSHQGLWNLYLNGKLWASGRAPKLQGAIIPEGGDLVVGQEYTDFDKGLDDGIEGDVFGFNFVLASTSNTAKPTYGIVPTTNYLRRDFNHHLTKRKNYGLKIYKRNVNPDEYSEEYGSYEDDSDSSEDFLVSNAPVKNYVTYRPPYTALLAILKPKSLVNPTYRNYPRKTLQKFSHSRIIGGHTEPRKPLGLLLVELTYDCRFKKGAPLNGKGVLVNWLETPVRVFGGAIMKIGPAFC